MKDDIACIINEFGAVGYIVCTGAGFSADSNISVYAGKDGKWEMNAPKGLSIKEIQEFGAENTFLKKPREFWDYFLEFASTINNNEPHKGYYKLLELIKNKPYYVVTSNIDGYHSRAGYNNVIECHGRLVNANKTINIQCSQFGECLNKDIWEWNGQGELPVCKKCGKIARPNYLSFNDYYCNIAPYTIENKVRDEMMKWLKVVKDEKIIIFEIGVGETVKTVKNRVNSIKKMCPNSLVIRINPNIMDDPLARGYINICKNAIDCF